MHKLPKTVSLVVLTVLLALAGICLRTVQAAPQGLSKPAYWVWPDMDVRGRISQGEIFVLQGRVTRQKDALFLEKRGIRPRNLDRDTKLHLLIRVDQLVPAVEVGRFVLDRIDEWESRQQPVVGVQIDFDSPTMRLSTYSRFLREIRQLIPPKYRLSITGLGDWILSAPGREISGLYAGVGEIFFQLYQSKEELGNERGILAKLTEFKHPFRVGLLSRQMGQPLRYQEVSQSPFFRGFVIFR